MASRALLNKDTSQVIPYKANKGAYKVVESKAYESFYGSVVIFNESSTVIEETFHFDRLDNFRIVDLERYENSSSDKGETKFDVSCPPGKAQVILLKRLSEKAAGMHFQSAVKPAASAAGRVIGGPMPASKFGLSSAMFADAGGLSAPTAARKPNGKVITPMQRGPSRAAAASKKDNKASQKIAAFASNQK